MEIKNTKQLFSNELRSNSKDAVCFRKKIKWRENQRNLPIGEKLELLGQTILEKLNWRKSSDMQKVCYVV